MSFSRMWTKRSLLVTGVLAVLLWMVFGSALLRLEVRGVLRGDPRLKDFSLEWTKRGDPLAHGVWLDEDEAVTSVLEIAPSGKPTNAGVPFEFWLYAVRDAKGRSVDLKALVRSGDPAVVGGSWKPFEQGPGVVYVGSEPGYLRMPVSTKLVTVHHARTDRGGIVDVRYRGEETRVDAYLEAMKAEALVLPRNPTPGEEVRFAQMLPVYRLASLEFKADGPVGATFKLDSPELAVKLFGITAARRELAVEPAQDAQASGEAGAFTLSGTRPALSLTGNFAQGPVFFVAGSAILFAGLLCIRNLSVVGLAAWAWLRRSPRGVQACVAGLLVCVNLAWAWFIPIMVTSDGADYLDGAAGLAFDPHTLDRVPVYKAPGLMFVLAVAMRLGRDFLLAFAFLHALTALFTCFFMYRLLRDRLGTAWGLAGALAVGLHPVLLTYQSYLLRECISAMLYTGIGFLLIAFAREARVGGKRAWALAVGLGVACGLAAYVRENMQMLLILAPLAAAWASAGSIRVRAGYAAAVLTTAFLMLLPYLHVRAWPHGATGVVVGKTHFNRALNLWTNKVHDGNDTAFLSREQWLDLQGAAAQGGVQDFDFIRRLNVGEPLRARTPELQLLDLKPLVAEPILKQVSDEAAARRPLAQLGSSLRAFANQLGLWNFYSPPDAASAEWFSKALRGRPIEHSTNYHISRAWLENHPRFEGNRERLLDMFDRSTRSMEWKLNPTQSFFNEWFWLVHALRPAVAVLFLVGVWRAIKRNERALAAMGLMAILMMAAAAIVVAPSPDRFSAPFIPTFLLLAFYAIATWREKRTPAPDSSSTSARLTSRAGTIMA